MLLKKYSWNFEFCLFWTSSLFDYNFFCEQLVLCYFRTTPLVVCGLWHALVCTVGSREVLRKAWYWCTLHALVYLVPYLFALPLCTAKISTAKIHLYGLAVIAEFLATLVRLSGVTNLLDPLVGHVLAH